VKNAAALSVTREYHPRHALNTIPGNLISYIDRALSDGWPVYPIVRNWTNEEPRLITLLFDRVLATGSTGFKATTGALFTAVTVQS
jgi:hypothetical protein